MWQVTIEDELPRLRVKATMDMETGTWKNTSTTCEIVIVEEVPFVATAVLMNDGDEKERIVPLWVFYGYVNDPEIKKVRIFREGFSDLVSSVENNTWLVVYQGLINEDVRFEAINDTNDILYTEEKK